MLQLNQVYIFFYNFVYYFIIKKTNKVSNPLSFAILPTFIEGSIPTAFTFNFLNGSNKIPSLDPISTMK